MSDRGTDRDRRVRDLMEDEDWFAVCSRGSHGCADVVAIRLGSIPKLIQVKSTAQGPYERFGPSDRDVLAAAARRGGAEALICWWPPRAKPRWIPESEWPKG